MRESLKPIEPGCLAMVTKTPKPDLEMPPPPTVGSIVTVIGRGHKAGPQWWLIDGYDDCWMHERCLIRIDPDEDQRRRWGAADRLQRHARRQECP